MGLRAKNTTQFFNYLSDRPIERLRKDAVGMMVVSCVFFFSVAEDAMSVLFHLHFYHGLDFFVIAETKHHDQSNL